MRFQNSSKAVLPEDWEYGGFGLYVHWPFCQSKCPYCDFNSHVSGSVDQSRWLAAYQAEIDRFGQELPDRKLKSIYFGGGTPSLMEASTVEGILAAARKAWSFSNDIEITLEANPTSVEASRFKDYRAAGVNRVSLGLQALNDDDLRRLGRLHSVSDGLTALEIAQSTFDGVSFDLIYARQDQTLESWNEELLRALSYGTKHLSLYQLTIEDGTAFHDRFQRGGLRGLPDENLATEMFSLTRKLTAKAGVPAYEISNHGEPGHESAHNMLYWRGGDYVGIGPGAHGRISSPTGRASTVCAAAPSAWLTKVENNRSGELAREHLSREEVVSEILMMGLRTIEGVKLDRLLPSERSQFQNKINWLVEEKLVVASEGNLKTTARGTLLLNSVLSELIND